MFAGDTLFWVGLAVIAAVLVLKGLVLVPTFHYGIVRRFGRLTEQKFDAGLHWVLPFVEDVLLESAGKNALSFDIKLTPIAITVLTEDKLAVTVEGSVQWKVDYALVETFATISADALARGISDAIKSEIGVVASVSKGDDFIRRRQAIQDLINQTLRRSKAAHICGTRFGLAEDVVKAEDRLRFYDEQVDKIKADHKHEHEEKGDRSAIETRYGIDIVTFELTNVAFDEKTKEALQSQQQTAAKMKAAQKQFTKKMAIYKRLRDAGMSHQEAINEASVTVGQAEKKIFSVEGLKNLFGGDA